MITEKDGKRVEQWIIDAVGRGTTLLCGGGRRSLICDATLIEDAPADSAVGCEEAFGPVATIERFDKFGDAIR